MSDLETRLARALRAPGVKAITAAERLYLDALKVPIDLTPFYATATREARMALHRIETRRAFGETVDTMRDVSRLPCVGAKAYRDLAGALVEKMTAPNGEP